MLCQRLPCALLTVFCVFQQILGLNADIDPIEVKVRVSVLFVYNN
jgi:hypothetical protein